MTLTGFIDRVDDISEKRDNTDYNDPMQHMEYQPNNKVGYNPDQYDTNNPQDYTLHGNVPPVSSAGGGQRQ